MIMKGGAWLILNKHNVTVKVFTKTQFQLGEE